MLRLGGRRRRRQGHATRRRCARGDRGADRSGSGSRSRRGSTSEAPKRRRPGGGGAAPSSARRGHRCTVPDAQRGPGRARPRARRRLLRINPGFHSDAKAAHFANPRNDFWRLLHAAGFTPRLVDPSEQLDVLEYGIGITNAAYRTTKGSSDLRKSDFDGSAERLERLALELRPRAIGFVGKEAYRGPFGGRPQHGLQERRLGETRSSSCRRRRRRTQRCRGRSGCAGSARSGARRVSAFRTGVLRARPRSSERLVLVRFDFPDRTVWATPRRGVSSADETDEDALRA